MNGNKFNENEMKINNDASFYSFDYSIMNFLNKGNNNLVNNVFSNGENFSIKIENDFIVKIICNVYNKHLNNQKFDLAQPMINITNYSVNNSKQINLELINKLVNIIPLIMKFCKEHLQTFSFIKRQFESDGNTFVKNKSLEEKIKISTEELSKLCDGIIASTSDIIKIFQSPLGVVNKFTKSNFDIVQFQKEEFYNLLIEDEFLNKLRKDFDYVDKIIEILKIDFAIEKQESIRIKKVLKDELLKFKNSYEDNEKLLMKEKEDIMDKISFNVQNIINQDSNKKIDIDDLVKYINEKDGKKTNKKKKKNKKKKDIPIINTDLIDNINNNNINNENNKNNENNNEEQNNLNDNNFDEIDQIKKSFRDNTVDANKICKIKVTFSKNWINRLGNLK